MGDKLVYLSALAAATLAFAASGGIHAAEHAVKIEEGKVAAAARPLGVEARIAFANQGGISDWQPDGSRGIFVQDVHRQWYRAGFLTPCTDLPFADAIGFVTRGPDDLDKFSSILVRGRQCRFDNFVTSEGPPRKDKPHRIAPAPASQPKG